MCCAVWLLLPLSSHPLVLPGFYDDVKSMDEREEALYRGLHFPLEDYKVPGGEEGRGAEVRGSSFLRE